MLKRLDGLLARVGLMRISQSRIRYDYSTKEICLNLGSWATHVHGFVCPTPDGPLKKIHLSEVAGV